MKVLIKILDFLLTFFIGILVLPVFFIYLTTQTLVAIFERKIINIQATVKHKNLLRLVPTNLKDIKRKGVMWMLYSSDENGYFYHVYTVHFTAEKTQKVLLNDKHTVIEIGKVLTRLKSKGLFFLYLFANGINFLYSIINMREFVKYNIALIRGYGPYHMGFAAVILHYLTGVPFCISIHADDDKRYEISKGKDVYLLFNSKLITDCLRRIVLSRARMVIVIRESLIPYLIKNGAREECVRVAPHGIYLDKFRIPLDLNFEKEWKRENKKLVVFAGRLYPENYISDIIYTAKKVKEKIPEILFLIIGDGVERKKAEELTIKMGLNDNILFLGFQPFERVIEFRKIAEVNLCLMAGLSLIESAAAARPMVSYDVEWHYELVRNNETGYLIKEHDIDGVAEAIIKLINNPDLARQYGENAKKLAFQRHSIEKASETKINCYEELLNSCSLKR